MDLTENPFFILGATTRDRKSRLIELADTIGLTREAEGVATARTSLINPRQRLTAEIAWFPGVSPKRVVSLLEILANQSGKADLSGFTEICKANFIVARLVAGASGGAAFRNADFLKRMIAQLASLVESIDPSIVMRDINEDRQASGFPAILDLPLVEGELTSRKRYFQRAITDLLDSTLPARELVRLYEQLMAESTADGKDAPPQLLSDLVSTYEIMSKPELDKRAAEIEGLVELTRAAASGGNAKNKVADLVQQIISQLRVWDFIAQPIQLNKKSKGIDHDESLALAFKIRSLMIDLFNEHDLIEESTLLTKELETLFAEVPVVFDKVSDDRAALDDIHLKRKKEAEEREEFERDITYETTFGGIFKSRFRISPKGIEWKNETTPLESITGVSWGGIRHSTNGVYTGTKYYIHYFSGRDVSIELTEQAKYNSITQCLWRGVAVRLLTEMMATWKNGGSVRFGNVHVADDGIVLRRQRFIKADETLFHKWSEVRKALRDGALFLDGSKDNRFKVSAGFINVYNVHILDFLLDRIWEGKASRLSEIFGK